jgi:hypothetical protein
MCLGHRNAALEAKVTDRWFAAEFHLQHLMRTEPENQDHKSWHERAVRELQRTKAEANTSQRSTPDLNPAVAEKPE